MARSPKVSDVEIMHCMNEGMTQVEIAERYGVHPTTICNRVKKINKGSTPPEKMTDPGVFNRMDTVIRKKDRKWFRIIGQEDVFYELRPLGQNKMAGSTNDIEVHAADLKKNYEKKDYPEVKCYNLADQEEKKEDDSMAEVTIEDKNGIASIPAEEAPVVENGMPIVPTLWQVKREFLCRIDQILDAVGSNASESVMEHTGRLIAQIIEEGIKGEK